MDRFYVGKVLDIYKQAASSRYDSVDNATSASSLSYLLRVFFPIQVQAGSYLFILELHNQPPGLPFRRIRESSASASIRLSFVRKAAKEALKKIKMQNGKIIVHICIYLIERRPAGEKFGK